MKMIESNAKTVEEAITAGLAELGASIGDVDIVVLEEGSKGLFGLFGSRNARVKLIMKEEESDLFADMMQDKPAKAVKPAAPKAEKAEKPAAPKSEKKPAAPKAEKKPAPKAEKPEVK